MLKINLMPAYIAEFARIRAVLIIFFILLALEGAVLYQASVDLDKQAKWYADDKPYYEQRKKDVEDAKKAAAAISEEAPKHKPFIDFYSREPAKQLTAGIVMSLQEAASVLGGKKAWYDYITVQDAQVQAEGKIAGLMNFLNFYYQMKARSFEVVPAAQPAASPYVPTMGQTVPLLITGTISHGLPKIPEGPSAVSSYGQLYESYKPPSATPPASTPDAGGMPPGGGPPDPGGPASPGATPPPSPGGAR